MKLLAFPRDHPMGSGASPPGPTAPDEAKYDALNCSRVDLLYMMRYTWYQNSDDTDMQNMMETKNRKRMWNLPAPCDSRSPFQNAIKYLKVHPAR